MTARSWRHRQSIGSRPLYDAHTKTKLMFLAGRPRRRCCTRATRRPNVVVGCFVGVFIGSTVRDGARLAFCRSNSSSCQVKTFSPYLNIFKIRISYLQSLNINRQNGHKEGVDQEPVRNKHYDGEGTELTNGTSREERDNAKNSVIRA